MQLGQDIKPTNIVTKLDDHPIKSNRVGERTSEVLWATWLVIILGLDIMPTNIDDDPIKTFFELER